MASKLSAYIKQFEYYKNLADKAIDQIDNQDDYFTEPRDGSNSIAVTMKHISGNMISRWTNIFEEDGEKEWRNRENEFEDNFKNLDEVFNYWEKAWNLLFKTLEDLTDSDLDKIIYIRNMGCSVHDAIIRQLCHYAYHIGQIVYMARYWRGIDFESLSIPRGKSNDYNKERFERPKTLKHFTDDK